MDDDKITLFAFGLEAVERIPEGMFLHFKGTAGTPDFRVALHDTGGRKMLSELQNLVRLLESPADQGRSPSGLN